MIDTYTLAEIYTASPIIGLITTAVAILWTYHVVMIKELKGIKDAWMYKVSLWIVLIHTTATMASIVIDVMNLSVVPK